MSLRILSRLSEQSEIASMLYDGHVCTNCFWNCRASATSSFETCPSFRAGGVSIMRFSRSSMVAIASLQ